MAKKRKASEDPERLRALIEEATIDCYGADEEFTGLLAMIQDEAVCPFRARVVGEEVEVTGFDTPNGGFGINAICQRKDKQYPVDLSSLEWIDPRPKGFEWIEAYLEWRKTLP